MKRDMDLVRKLLFHFEAQDDLKMEELTEIDGYRDDKVQHHLIILAGANLIQFEASRSTTNPDRLIKVYPFGLSWEGLEFLDAARNDTIWNKVKRRTAKIGGGVGLDLMKQLLLAVAKEELGLC